MAERYDVIQRLSDRIRQLRRTEADPELLALLEDARTVIGDEIHDAQSKAQYAEYLESRLRKNE